MLEFLLIKHQLIVHNKNSKHQESMYLQLMPELQMMKQQHLITNWDYVWEKNLEIKFMELFYNIFIFFLLKG
jgi:hypothetical protein